MPSNTEPNLEQRLTEEFVDCSSCGSEYLEEDLITLACGCCVACSSCTGYCERCDNSIVLDSEYCHDGSYYCRDCHDAVSMKFGLIRPWNAKAHAILGYKGQPKKEQPYIGVEVEVEVRKGFRMEECARRVLDALGDDKVILKEDSSLTYGFEIVSAPSTLERHRHIWSAFADPNKAREIGIKSFRTETCGMHVHLSRWAGTENNHPKGMMSRPSNYYPMGRSTRLTVTSKLILRKMRYFLCSDRKFTAFLCNRLSNQYSVWDHRSRISYRSPDKYNVVNERPDQTVETRGYKGNLKYSRIMKGIELTYALADFCRKVSLLELMDIRPAQLLFLDFLQDQPRRYPNTNRYLTELKGRRLSLRDRDVLPDYFNLPDALPGLIRKS